MSRSSSGPGVAIQNPSGYGLGIIPFDGHLRFGEHEPISVEDAQRRTAEWERRLVRDRDLAQGRERRRIEMGGTPYPDERAMTGYPELNLIPTQSSPEFLRAMVGENEQGVEGWNRARQDVVPRGRQFYEQPSYEA
ncbi:MAG: hypothetical protein Q9213_001363 [Squamulea squamosa]